MRFVYWICQICMYEWRTKALKKHHISYECEWKDVETDELRSTCEQENKWSYYIFLMRVSVCRSESFTYFINKLIFETFSRNFSSSKPNVFHFILFMLKWRTSAACTCWRIPLVLHVFQFWTSNCRNLWLLLSANRLIVHFLFSIDVVIVALAVFFCICVSIIIIYTCSWFCRENWSGTNWNHTPRRITRAVVWNRKKMKK